MGASGSSEDKSETWPPDWDALSAEKRKLARAAILSLSERPPEEFLTMYMHMLHCHRPRIFIKLLPCASCSDGP